MLNRNLKLLIVDDEAEIREGILHSIPWEEHGIVVAGLATNGREALRMIAETKPDLMLLDIRMPVMNGLEALERLAEGQTRPKVIILSGYDDFSYCQKALRYGVADYLLKPCRPQEILGALLKLKEEVRTEEEQAHQWDHLLQKFQENIPILRENLLMNLVQDKPADLQAALSRWNLYQMEVAPQNIGLALVRIDQQHKLASLSRSELELTKLSLYREVEAITKLPPSLKSFVNYFHDNIMILWNIQEEAADLFARRLEKLRRTVEAGMAVTVTIGLGEPATDLSQLPAAFHSAILALDLGIREGANRIVHYREVIEDHSENRALIQEENLIVHCIRTNNPGRLESALDSFFANLSTPGKNSKDYVQKMITALICSVYHVCLERGFNTDSIFGPNLAILDELPRIETLKELRQRILLCCKQIIERHPLQKTQWKMVTEAVKYIEEHFAEDLNLENIAKVVFASPGYLSTSFKQVLQKNFVDYLAEVRVGKAKELLKDFHLKIYEVAVRTGYKDEKYFSQIFKKITGMTPNQYRDSVAGPAQNRL
ncbi:MAG: response regulator [Bacillota bacterium]